MITIIIPVYNESSEIHWFLRRLVAQIKNEQIISEIIIVDGQSTDNTYEKTRLWIDGYGGKIPFLLLRSTKSKAIQQNKGAQHAQGKILFFLHADCLPEKGFETKIEKNSTAGKIGGVCLYISSPQKRRTRLINHFYNLKIFYWCRFGDSGIIVSKDIFQKIGGFDETMRIEEDHLFIMQLRKRNTFSIYPISLYVSNRLFQKNGFFKTLTLYMCIHLLFVFGVKQKTLLYLLRHLKGIKN